MRQGPRYLKLVSIFSLLLGLLFIIACGTAAPDPAEPPAQDSPPQSAEGPTPTAVAESVPGASNGATPAGAINVGLTELGTFRGHPARSIIPALTVANSAPIGESLLLIDIDREVKGWLLESFSISEDFQTWTLKVRQGVQFHQGYGEMTAEDVVWSFREGWTQNDVHARVANMRHFWAHPNGHVETPDPYTVVVNTGEPLSAAVVQEQWMVPSASAHWVASKRQFDEVGMEAADQNPALTGPWEMVGHRTGEFWRMQAVENHWNQTPYFNELVFWELPEESARLAGFQTGQLDTFTMAFDSIPLVQGIRGARLMSVPGGGADYALRFYGNYHVEALAGEPPSSYDPALPWVSNSAEVDSDDWQRAVKVRKAMIFAIDRESIIDTILGGFARPGLLRGWSNNEEQLGNRHWEYNPDQARELLQEAGYSGGFRITLTPSIRAAPGEVELCEAVATMWNNELGLNVSLQRVPYATLRPQLAGRTYQGAVCHAAPQRLVVGGDVSLTTLGGTSLGVTHPFLEDIIPRINETVDDQARIRMEQEVGQFLFDNALTSIGLAVGDAVWPVGPRFRKMPRVVQVWLPAGTGKAPKAASSLDNS